MTASSVAYKPVICDPTTGQVLAHANFKPNEKENVDTQYITMVNTALKKVQETFAQIGAKSKELLANNYNGKKTFSYVQLTDGGVIALFPELDREIPSNAEIDKIAGSLNSSRQTYCKIISQMVANAIYKDLENKAFAEKMAALNQINNLGNRLITFCVVRMIKNAK